MAWLVTVSWISIVLSVGQAIIIAADTARRPQKMMPIMNLVWPLIGLFYPISGIWTYYAIGRATHRSTSSQHGQGRPRWQGVLVSTTHCSSGCALGDMIGAPLVFATGLLIAGSALLTDYIVEFVLAYIFGIAFQYFGMGLTKHESPIRALTDAIKADTLSLISFEVGMFGWMALVSLVFFASAPEPTTPVFWFMMQIAMLLGFVTSYPANWILVSKGVKHAM